jgi:adenosylcobyric acid synthase
VESVESRVRGGLLVAGTSSDAGKSTVAAGLCRWLARQGVSVAPFKALNMSLNSFVTSDGAEIGRSQAVQAQAAGTEPTADMNPVLLKPGAGGRTHVILHGQPFTDVDPSGYRERSAHLLQAALASLDRLRARFDVVICEGAGSPAEINLRDTDIANMGLARAAGLPVIVTGDIDRGGVFAALHGTLALLEPADQALVAGFVINKFRGAAAMLSDGLAMFTALAGRPVLGVLPWQDGLDLDAEDSLSLDNPSPAGRGHAAPSPSALPHPASSLTVAVVRLPRISNFTDVDALATEPGVLVRFTTARADLDDADLVILPGSRATVADLEWLRSTGLAGVIAQRAERNQPVLGICGGYQMLAAHLDDQVESKRGRVGGLGLLPVTVEFTEAKTLARPATATVTATATTGGAPVRGYEIHHGQVTVHGQAEPFPGGCRRGSVWGTSWHGTLENDEFRRAFLTEVAAAAHRDFTPAPGTDFGARREARLDLLAGLVGRHLDTAALTRLIEEGPPPGLPIVPPAGASGI